MFEKTKEALEAADARAETFEELDVAETALDQAKVELDTERAKFARLNPIALSEVARLLEERAAKRQPAGFPETIADQAKLRAAAALVAAVALGPGAARQVLEHEGSKRWREMAFDEQSEEHNALAERFAIAAELVDRGVPGEAVRAIADGKHWDNPAWGKTWRDMRQHPSEHTPTDCAHPKSAHDAALDKEIARRAEAETKVAERWEERLGVLLTGLRAREEAHVELSKRMAALLDAFATHAGLDRNEREDLRAGKVPANLGHGHSFAAVERVKALESDLGGLWADVANRETALRERLGKLEARVEDVAPVAHVSRLIERVAGLEAKDLDHVEAARDMSQRIADLSVRAADTRDRLATAERALLERIGAEGSRITEHGRTIDVIDERVKAFELCPATTARRHIWDDDGTCTKCRVSRGNCP